MLTRHDVRRRLQRWTKLGERIDGLRAMIRAIQDDIDGVGDLKSPNLDGLCTMDRQSTTTPQVVGSSPAALTSRMVRCASKATTQKNKEA